VRWLVLVAACADPAPSQPPPPPLPPLPPGAHRLVATWSHIQLHPDCGFFSGPQGGRDDSLKGDAILVRHGSDLELKLGTVTFIGGVDDAEVALLRTSTHALDDGPWRVTETIYGERRDGIFHGTYHYTECGPGEFCPDRCTIDAELELAPR
jgi:hypothetical protein